jgi:lipopolysaccharide/colanic/teichoic acid biosynthesis glycosyltransferase
MLLIAVGIKLTSKGPVIFRQERIGLSGKPFLCLKFRSMRCDADVTLHKEHLRRLMESDAPLAKLDSSKDPRLIHLGGLLRASGLDELPQLFNIIRGEMSLVGPRPCTRYEYEQYQPWQKERFSVLPGLTGLWQVTGKNKTTFEQMVQLDIQYARTLSLRADLFALVKTFGVVATQVRDTLAQQTRRGPNLAVLKRNMS